MLIISHRGNLNGVSTNENTIEQINLAHSNGFDVEIDVWFCKGHFYLGHDKPSAVVDERFLTQSWIWCHAKNLDALEHLNRIGSHYFWHESDKLTITSRGFLWCANAIFIKNGITVTNSLDLPPGILGICTDNPISYI